MHENHTKMGKDSLDKFPWALFASCASVLLITWNETRRLEIEDVMYSKGVQLNYDYVEFRYR